MLDNENDFQRISQEKSLFIASLDFKWIIKNNLLAPHIFLHHIHNFINNFTTQLLDPWEKKFLARLISA